MARATLVLPLPLSPTNAIVVALAISNVILSTARNCVGRPSTPSRLIS